MDMKEWVRRTWHFLDRRSAADVDQGYTASQIRTVLAAAMEALTDELEQGGDLTLRGFGRLYVEIRLPRQISSNLMGKIVYRLPARRGVRFQAAERLLARINETFVATMEQDSDG